MTTSAPQDPTTPSSSPETARERVAAAAGSARTATSDAYAAARERVGTALSDAGESAGAALDDARARFSSAAAATRETVDDARARASEGIQDNPVAALVGGLVLGAVAAAVLPRTDREDAAFGALGSRLNDAAREALSAGRNAGREKLGELGLTPDKAQETVSRLVGDVAKAATSAGSAAAASARDGATARQG